MSDIARLTRLTRDLGDVGHNLLEWGKSIAANMPGTANNDRRHLLASLEKLRDASEAWAKTLRRTDD